jgi:hypothetical protein
MAYIVKGFIAQFIKSVNHTGLVDLPAFITSAKSIFTIIGYIMKNKQMAIGMETTGAPLTYIERPSRNFAMLGATLPINTPNPMHTKTHKVRYFSKKLKPLFF